MKKKVIKKKNEKAENVVMISALIVAGFAVLLCLYSWWQVSDWTFKEFTFICEANGGGNCMAFYWRQLAYFQWVLKGSIATIVVSLGVAVWAGMEKKH